MIWRICVVLLLSTSLVAEWVKIPVLDPEKHEPMDDSSELALKGSSALEQGSIDHKVSNPSSFSSKILAVENLEQNEGIVKEEDLDEESIPSINYNSTNDSFMQSVMNNSQKVEEIKVEFPSFPNNLFLPSEFLRNIHRTLLYQAPTSNQGKVAFLENLKLKLYSYIKPKVALFWDLKGREARMDKGMTFPSMDGALMTISFLLFAVFLIKLVQQLIQQVQDKANAQAMLMTGATPVVPARPAVPAIPATPGRRKREIPADVYAAAQLFHLIEKFHANS